MSLSFNLVDEPWIRCVTDRGPVEMSLRGTLLGAPGIREIVDPSPLITIALHRLLLATLHRALDGPKNAAQWCDLWRAGAWPEPAIVGYFDRWRERFDLFDEHHPFYQTPGLDISDARPTSGLAHEIASGGNAATLFDHTLSLELSPAAAARYLVAHQAFAVSGTVSYRRRKDPRAFRYADAAPLAQSAVALVTGRTLFDTLMLNLVRYSRKDEEPFPFSDHDAPAWERDRPPAAEDRAPGGYLDLLTWQARRVRLFPEAADDGTIVVRKAALMKGYQFPDGFLPRGKETMVAFTKARAARADHDPFPPVGFTESRALWRDSLALLETVGGERWRPKTIDWLAGLADERCLARDVVFPLDVFGLSTNRANVLLWRHERVPLPLEYLSDADLRSQLREALELAEGVWSALLSGLRALAEHALAPESDRAGARQPRSEDVNTRSEVLELIRGLGADRVYWSRLEPAFRRLVLELAEARSSGGSAEEDEIVSRWLRTLRRCAFQAFREATDSFEACPRTVKGVAVATRLFNTRLRILSGGAAQREGGGDT